MITWETKESPLLRWYDRVVVRYRNGRRTHVAYVRDPKDGGDAAWHGITLTGFFLHDDWAWLEQWFPELAMELLL